MSVIKKIGARLFSQKEKNLAPFLLVGLGNPGIKYEKTKHNFGFLLADQIIADYSLSLRSQSKSYQLFQGSIKEQKIFLLKPLKYMNLSGGPLLEIKNFYKINIENILVLHDDLDLDFGKIKLKQGGGNAGHNGLKDIDSKIGKNYLRLRLGIGRPANQEYEISDYVLSKFSADEMGGLKEINSKISELLPVIFSKNRQKFINQFSQKT